jgi:tetratricopeptide (TPR) repeat protein
MSSATKNDKALTRKAAGDSPGVLRSGFVRLSCWFLVLGLIALNARLAWESRPLPDLATISRLMQKERYSEAEKLLRAYLRRSPHQGEARMMLARVLAARNDVAGSASELHRVPFWWPNKPEALFREGQMQMALGRARLAEEAWKICLANDPYHPTPPQHFTRAAYELVELYKWEERREDARELIWRVYQQVEAADHAEILILGVWIELLRINPAEIVEKVSRFVAADADDREARLSLAHAEMASGNADEALRQIQICLKEHPNDLLAWREWLMILRKQGDEQALTRALSQLPESTQADPEIWTIRGAMREQAADWRGAEAAYDQAIRLRPKSAEVHYKLAIVKDRLGEHAAAEEHRKRYRELRDAREQLVQVYDAYFDATRTPGAVRGDLTPIFERLATTCAELGFEREGKAWQRLCSKQ